MTRFAGTLIGISALALTMMLCGCASKKKTVETEDLNDLNKYAYLGVPWGASEREMMDYFRINRKKYEITPELVLLRRDEFPHFDYQKLLEWDLARWKLGGEYRDAFKKIKDDLAKCVNARVYKISRGNCDVKLYFDELVPLTVEPEIFQERGPNPARSASWLTRVKFIFAKGVSLKPVLAKLRARYGPVDLVDGQAHIKFKDLEIDVYAQGIEGEGKGKAVVVKTNTRDARDFKARVNNAFLGLLSEEVDKSEKFSRKTTRF